MSKFTLVGPPLLVIGGSLLYHVAAKSVPKTVAPLAALIGVYFTALVASIVAYAAANRTAPSPLSAIGHPTIAAVGLGVLMIELGFLLTYRAAWPVSMASVMMNGIVAVLLLPVGAALFGETITFVRLMGVVLCLLGLTLLQK